MTTSIHNISETFSVMTPDMDIRPVPVTPGLYTELDENFAGFKSHVLISAYAFTENWPTWEKHPFGDELVMLLSGAATMFLRIGAQNTPVALTKPGNYAIVPRDTWHTAHVSEPTRMLFFTPGEGTENRESP